MAEVSPGDERGETSAVPRLRAAFIGNFASICGVGSRAAFNQINTVIQVHGKGTIQYLCGLTQIHLFRSRTWLHEKETRQEGGVNESHESYW